MSYTDFMEGLGFNMDMTRALTGQPVTPETSQPATAVPLFDGMQSFSEANPNLVGMPTEQQLMGAMRNAHSAGDTAAAQRFAGMIKQVRNPNDYSKLAQSSDAMLNSVQRMGEGALRLPQVLTDAAFQAMGRDPSQGYDEGGQELLNRFNAAADAIAQQSKDTNYTPVVRWDQLTDNPSAENILGFMGEATVGSLPDMAMAMVSAPAYFATYIAPIALKRAKNDGRTVPTPADVAAAMVSAAGIAAAERFGAKGIFGGVSGNIATRPIKAGVRESATEAIQSPLEYAGQTLGTDKGFNPAVALDQAAAGAVGGFGAGTGIRGTIDVTNAIGDPSSMRNPANQPEDSQAAADFARDLETIAQEEGLDLKDVSKTATGGSRQALDLQHVRYDGEMQRLRNILKEQLKLKDTDPEIVQIDKMLAQLAYREARTKTKNIVGQREFAAVDRLVGNTKEGSELINVMRKTNELTKLHNAGYQGGVSQFTDQFAPFGVGIGYDRGAQNAERLLRPLISGGIATNTGGMSLIGQTAAVGAGRAIDAVTGNRSRVNKYVNKNRKRDGMTSLTEPSMLEQARELEQANILATAQANQREQDRRQDAFIRGNLPAANSPEATMIIATGGLPTEVIMEIARDVAARDPNLAQPARDFIDSVTGQRPVDAGDFEGLTDLIREIKTVAANNPEYSQLANPQLAAQLSENYTTPVPAAMGGSTPTGVAPAPRDVSAGYVRGIEANREAADRLADEVSNDTSISPRDKVVLLSALEDLRGNLGLDPVNKAQQVGVDTERSLSDPALADKYLMPYINRVAGQQELDIEAAVPEIGQGQAVRPVPPKQSVNVLGAYDPEGQYVAMPSGEVISGNTYDGARIYINPNGFGGMEVDTTQQQDAKPDKSFGKRFRTNLFKKFNTSKNGKKTNNLWTWTNQPEGNPRTENDQEFLVAFVSDNKHYYTTDLQTNVPTELDKDRGNINAGNQPFLRPSGYGQFTLGEPIGYIRTGRGNIHPVYDQIRVEPKDGSREQLDINLSSSDLINEDPFAIGDDMALTAMDILPTDEELAAMQDGSFKPAKAKKKERVYGELQEKWEEAAGQSEPLAYTPENMERIARMMATEALRSLQKDSNAIGWYDAKLKAAKSVLKLVEPRLEQNEAAFDYILAVTSNGQAVTENFKYALDGFRTFLDTGQMPENFKQGGERNKAMVASFKFYNAYQKASRNMPIDMFLDTDFTVRELQEYLDDFNEANETEFTLGNQENADALVKGSYVLGAKIGQGFYQNLRGNYEPLTADLWWMRMWNRMIGRPFTPPKSEDNMNKNRKIIADGIKGLSATIKQQTAEVKALEADPNAGKKLEAAKAALADNKQMAKLIKDTFKSTGVERKGLYKDPTRFDPFIRSLNANYQSFYAAYKKANGVNHKKPDLFKKTGTHVLNLDPQLQATPKGGTERQFMRDTVAKARQLLITQGYDINTADFQALMWYPEKQLARKLGVAKGKGEDNDYLDAAILAANKEGISDDRIKEALPDAERDRLFGGTGSPDGQDGSADTGARGTSVEETVIEYSRGFDSGSGGLGSLPSRPADADLIRQQLEAIEVLFADGQPIPIGMSGTPFENGLTIEAAQKVAEALNYAFLMYKNPTEMKKDLYARTRNKLKGSAKGLNAVVPSPDGEVMDRTTGKRVAGFIMGLAPNKTYKMDLPESIYVMMHELGHALERLPFQAAEKPTQMGKYIDRQGDERQARSTFNETFRGYLTQIIDATSGKSTKNPADRGTIMNVSQQDAQEIIDEVINMQRLGILSTSAGEFRVRDEYARFADRIIKARKKGYSPADMATYEAGQKKEMIDHEDSYLHTPQELAADMIGMYLTDPKGFKKQAPNAARFVQIMLNSARAPSSNFVEFYSAPFAAVVATILATMQLGEEEEEQKKGALSLGQGALSI